MCRSPYVSVGWDSASWLCILQGKCPRPRRNLSSALSFLMFELGALMTFAQLAILWWWMLIAFNMSATAMARSSDFYKPFPLRMLLTVLRINLEKWAWAFILVGWGTIVLAKLLCTLNCNRPRRFARAVYHRMFGKTRHYARTELVCEVPFYGSLA